MPGRGLWLWASLLLGCAGKDGDSAGATGTHTCAEFCDAYFDTCPGTGAWADKASCQTACAAWDQGDDGDTSGNTLECRYTAVDTAGSDATSACAHAGPDGGGICVD